MSKRIPITRLREIVSDGNVFYVAEGQVPPGYVLASGPPVYIFGSDGNLVEWVRDSGDQLSRMEKWRTTNAREIPLDRVVQEIKEREE